MKYLKSLAVLMFMLISCSNTNSQENMLGAEKAFPNLDFNRPVDLQSANDGSNTLYVVEQAGKIYSFSNEKSVTEKTIFLDIRDQVDDGGNEEGLLGLAFHPNFKNNSKFYVNYTASDPSRTVISEFSKGIGQTDFSEKIIIEFDQPYSNHNGGQVAFGPDGFLYIVVGDGGSGGDPKGHAQNRKTLLGSILRIDVDNSAGNLNYSIPEDNPFNNNTEGFREEIFAYGLRNPWRFCFNPEDGRLWTGDVGQNKFEEIDIVLNGGNYGWNFMEGNDCYGSSADCQKPGLIKPIHEYSHSVGQSVTGGYFYQNSDIPELANAYIYGDFVAGKIWGLFYENGKVQKNQLLTEEVNLISSFGVDAKKQLYILSFDGAIYSLISK